MNSFLALRFTLILGSWAPGTLVSETKGVPVLELTAALRNSLWLEFVDGIDDM